MEGIYPLHLILGMETVRSVVASLTENTVRHCTYAVPVRCVQIAPFVAVQGERCIAFAGGSPERQVADSGVDVRRVVGVLFLKLFRQRHRNRSGHCLVLRLGILHGTVALRY